MARKVPTTITGQPRTRCIRIAPTTKTRCKYYSYNPRSRLCKTHEDEALIASGLKPRHEKDPAKVAAKVAEAQVTKIVKSTARNVSNFVITQQARDALATLGSPYATRMDRDPKRILLDAVRSAHDQRLVWEAMLASIPEEDWAMIGTPGLPGSIDLSKGVRIEKISQFLQEATKSAARISKLALDAGIEERLVHLAEEQSALIADTVRAGVLAAIDALLKQGTLTPAGAELAKSQALGAAATHLRQLAAGGKEIIEGVATEMDTSPAASPLPKVVTPAESELSINKPPRPTRRSPTAQATAKRVLDAVRPR